MAAVERADLAAVADLLSEDVRAAMPPWTLWLAGRPAVMAALVAFHEPALFSAFGLPDTVPAGGG